MTDVNAARAAAKEYREGLKMRKALKSMNCFEIAKRHGISENRVRRIRRGLVDSSLVHEKYLEIKSEIEWATFIRRKSERKSIKALAERYHLAQSTISRYAGLEG